MDIRTIIQNNQGTLVDVRTSAEYNMGNVSGSINIPVQDVMEKMDELKKLPTPLVLFCASGARSGHATEILKSNGIDCINGGSWITINMIKKEKNNDKLNKTTIRHGVKNQLC